MGISLLQLKHAGFLVILRWRGGSTVLAGRYRLVLCLLVVLVVLAVVVVLVFLVGRVFGLLLLVALGLLFLLPILFLLVFLLYALDLLVQLPLPACVDGGLVDLGRAKARVFEVGGTDVKPVLHKRQATPTRHTSISEEERTLLSAVMSTLVLSL